MLAINIIIYSINVRMECTDKYEQFLKQRQLMVGVEGEDTGKVTEK